MTDHPASAAGRGDDESTEAHDDVDTAEQGSGDGSPDSAAAATDTSTETPTGTPTGTPTSTSVWAGSVVLGDGDTAYIRPLVPADKPALRAFHERQSPESSYRRFFSPKPTLSDTELEHFTNVDMVDRAALAIELRDEFVAWASYERWPDRPEAEAAFMVDDEHHGQGMATLLLEHLAAIARANGIERFTAEVLADNRPMLAVFAKAGWPLQRRFDSGVVDLDWELAPTNEYIDSVERREQRADARAIARLLLPRSIAVVGASDRQGSVGNIVWRHVSQSTDIPIHAVNPRLAATTDVLDGHPCVASVDDLPDDVSLAIIVVSVRHLESTVDACIRKRMRGAIVITNVNAAPAPRAATSGAAGDAETADETTPADETPDLNALVARSRRNGLRIIGPSSMGVASLSQQGGLQATLVDVDIPAGNVAISLQSGSLGVSMLQRARELELGISWFVSLGDKLDVSTNDLLQFWENDEGTRVIAMYTETFGNPRKFARIARRVSLQRPIVAVRAGAAATGSLGGALFQQAGVIEVPTVHAMLDTVRVLATQPPLSGPRVAVITNSQSPGILARDALRTAGLEPIDDADRGFALGWYASGEDVAQAVTAAMESSDVDGVMVIHAPAILEHPDTTAELVDRAAAGGTKPIVAIMLGRADGPLVSGSDVPAFSFPEQAAAVLGRSFGYSAWQQRESAEDDSIRHVDPERARALIRDEIDRRSAELTEPGSMLTVTSPDRCRELLHAYGISMAGGRTVDHTDAVEAASGIGYPVAIKAATRTVGRSVEAGVALDVTDDDEVLDVIERMRSALGIGADRVIVQAMVAPGVDVRIRCQHDPRSGTIVSVGLGGLTADVVDDVTSRISPVSPATAVAMVNETRVGRALSEARTDSSRLVDVIVQVAQLASDHPELAEVDLNPVIVSGHDAVVTDATIRLRPHDHPDRPLRRLD